MNSLVYWYGTFEFLLGAFLAVPTTIYVYNRKEEFKDEIKFICKFVASYAAKRIRAYKKSR